MPIPFVESEETIPCRCGSTEERHKLLDGRGIFIDYVCDECEDETRAKYRPEIFEYYTQDDVDEPIEPDGDGFYDE